jgi:hypothetical protein
MVDPQILGYIVAQERAGYTPEQIKQALLQNGYPQADVDQAFRQLGPANQDPVVLEYAQQYQRQGLPAAQVFQQLVQQGYPPNVARKAVRDVYGVGLPAEHHVKMLSFLLVAVIVAVGGVYFITSGGPAEEHPSPIDGNVPIPVNPSQVIAGIIVMAKTQGSAAGAAECQNALSGDDRDTCITSVALATEDDAICDMVSRERQKDQCLMNFLDSRFESVCGRVVLRESAETCDRIRQLQA